MEVLIVEIEYEDGACVWKYLVGDHIPRITSILKKKFAVRVMKKPKGWVAVKRPIKTLKIVTHFPLEE